MNLLIPRAAALLNAVRIGRCRLIPRAAIRKQKIAVCFAVRNRGGMRAWNCLASLRWQTVPANNVEIVICDHGSNQETTQELKDICRQFKARLILLNQQERRWHKTWVMNVAIKNCTSSPDVILASDIDMIYAPNFIEELLRPHILLPGRTFGICQSGDLPENLCSEQTGRLTPVNFYALCKLAKYARDPAIGVCQSFSRSWIEKVHGYDERFELDAYEDNDMEKRAVLSNLWFANVASRTTLLHQWHEINKSALFPGGGFEAVRERNKQMWMDGVSVVRNPEGWGILPDGASIIEPEM